MPLSLLQDGRASIASVVFTADFSSISSNAARYAAFIAAHFEAELVATHSFLPSQAAHEAEMATQEPREDRKERLQQLSETANTLTSMGPRVRTQFLDGDPSEAVPAFADSLPQGLLVVGTHGGSSLERCVIGSVAERCLRRTSSPVITVGPHVPAPNSPGMFSEILYATDCSKIASRAAPFACAIADSFRSELKVISIVDEVVGSVPDLLADLDFRTRREIERLLSGACDHFIEMHAAAKAETARDEILRYALQMHSDLIILCVHRKRPLELLDRNSIPIQLIAEASCPVLTVNRHSSIARSDA